MLGVGFWVFFCCSKETALVFLSSRQDSLRSLPSAAPGFDTPCSSREVDFRSLPTWGCLAGLQGFAAIVSVISQKHRLLSSIAGAALVAQRRFKKGIAGSCEHS